MECVVHQIFGFCISFNTFQNTRILPLLLNPKNTIYRSTKYTALVVSQSISFLAWSFSLLENHQGSEQSLQNGNMNTITGLDPELHRRAEPTSAPVGYLPSLGLYLRKRRWSFLVFRPVLPREPPGVFTEAEKYMSLVLEGVTRWWLVTLLTRSLSCLLWCTSFMF